MSLACRLHFCLEILLRLVAQIYTLIYLCQENTIHNYLSEEKWTIRSIAPGIIGTLILGGPSECNIKKTIPSWKRRIFSGLWHVCLHWIIESLLCRLSLVFFKCWCNSSSHFIKPHVPGHKQPIWLKNALFYIRVSFCMSWKAIAIWHWWQILSSDEESALYSLTHNN